MEPALKHRLIGAAVISALAIIFLPMLIVAKDPNASVSKVPLKAPAAPAGDFQTQELPLVTPTPTVPAGGVVGMNTNKSASPTASPASPAGASGVESPSAASGASATASPVLPASPPSPAVPAPAASGKAPPPVAAAAATSAVASPASPAALPEQPPIPAADAGGRYVVNLGTYFNTANAQSLVASLKARQIPAYAEAVTMLSRPALRVRIGPFQQRGDAEAARLRARQMHEHPDANVIALDAAAPAPVPAPAIAAALKTPASSTIASPASPHAPPAATGKTSMSAVSSSTESSSPPAATATHGYAIQVGAFGAQAQAEALRDKLRAAGFTAYSEKVQTESGVRWRLRVGPVADHEGATRLQADLKTKEKLNGLVVSYP